MTTEALITLVIAWAYVLFFAGYFFRKVLKTPQKKGHEENVE